MKMRKVVSAMLVAAMATGMVAGCGSSSDSKSDKKDAKGKVYYLNFKPEQDEQWQDLAKEYTKETGVDVTVLTAASGEYEKTLKSEMAKSNAPTLFQVNGPVGLASWKDYCYDLKDSDVAKQLTSDDFALMDGDKMSGIAYVIESYGIIYNKELLKKADLVLYVVDTSDPLTKDDEEIMQLIEGKQTIVLLNKADLEQVVTKENLKGKGFDQIVQISAKEQTGIEELYQLIQDIFFEGHVSFNDEIYLTNMRHKTEVSEALKSLSMVLQSIEDGMPEDFFSIDLLDAYEHLGFITGESVGEDLVNEIFAEFCMGK